MQKQQHIPGGRGRTSVLLQAAPTIGRDDMIGTGGILDRLIRTTTVDHYNFTRAKLTCTVSTVAPMTSASFRTGMMTETSMLTTIRCTSDERKPTGRGLVGVRNASFR